MKCHEFVQKFEAAVPARVKWQEIDEKTIKAAIIFPRGQIDRWFDVRMIESANFDVAEAEAKKVVDEYFSWATSHEKPPPSER